MYVCMYDLSPSQPFSDEKHLSPFQKKNFEPRIFTTYPKFYGKETPFMDLLLNSQKYLYATWQINMEPTIHPFAKENHLPNLQCVSEYHRILAKYENSRPTKT